jgi:hypothetical protein
MRVNTINRYTCSFKRGVYIYLKFSKINKNNSKTKLRKMNLNNKNIKLIFNINKICHLFGLLLLAIGTISIRYAHRMAHIRSHFRNDHLQHSHLPYISVDFTFLSIVPSPFDFLVLLLYRYQRLFRLVEKVDG